MELMTPIISGIAKHSTIQFHIGSIPNKLPVLLIH